MSAARDRFLLFVSRNTVGGGRILPLVHITTAFRFADMLSEEKLVPKHCPIMNEDLIYFFYGRPAYKPKDAAISELNFSWPIVFIFDSLNIHDIRRVFPFDTGAFVKNIYSGFFHSDTTIKDFELDGNLSNAQAIVDGFYQSQRSYLTGFADKNIDIGLFDFEVQGLNELHRVPSFASRDIGQFRDERSSTVEIQVGCEVSIPNKVLGIVIPQPFLGDKNVVRAIDSWNIKYKEFYEPTGFGDQRMSSGQIYLKVISIYQREGII